MSKITVKTNQKTRDEENTFRPPISKEWTREQNIWTREQNFETF